jgi:hypothetical protein
MPLLRRYATHDCCRVESRHRHAVVVGRHLFNESNIGVERCAKDSRPRRRRSIRRCYRPVAREDALDGRALTPGPRVRELLLEGTKFVLVIRHRHHVRLADGSSVVSSRPPTVAW